MDDDFLSWMTDVQTEVARLDAGDVTAPESFAFRTLQLLAACADVATASVRTRNGLRQGLVQVAAMSERLARGLPR